MLSSEKEIEFSDSLNNFKKLTFGNNSNSKNKEKSSNIILNSNSKTDNKNSYS